MSEEKDFIGTYQWACLWVLVSFLIGMFYPYDYFGEGRTIFLLIVYAYASLFAAIHVVGDEIELPRLIKRASDE